MTTATSPRTCTLPPDRLYWSILDVPPGTRIRPGPLPIGLRPLFEEDVPLEPAAAGSIAAENAHSASDLHVVCTPLSRGRVLACGAPRAQLLEAATSTEHPRPVETLTPACFPAFIDHELLQSAAPSEQPSTTDASTLAASLNLLIGDLEPSHLRAARLRRHIILLVAALLACAFILIGLERRIQHDHALAAQSLAAADTRLEDLGRSLNLPVRLTPATLPSVVAIAQRSADAAARLHAPTDTAPHLAALLAVWPRPPATNDPLPPWVCIIQSLHVDADSIGITCSVEGDTPLFLKSLSAPPGFTLDEPRLTSAGRSTRLATNKRDQPNTGEDLASRTITRLTISMKRNAAQPAHVSVPSITAPSTGATP